MNQIHEKNFEQEVLKNDLPVVVDFSAVWCGSCQQIAPFIEQIADEMTSKVKIVQVDVDADEALAVQYDVQSLPTLLLFKQGKVVSSFVGGATKSELVNWLQSNL